MADAELNALSSGAPILPADLLYLEKAATQLGSKVTIQNFMDYIDQKTLISNGSIANQSITTTDAYLAGSDCAIPANGLKVRTKYNLRIALQKTAGTGIPTLNVRVGTAGTTADASRCLFTFPRAHTSVADEAWFEIMITFRSIGSGTSATLQGGLKVEHRLTTTGFDGTGGGANYFVNTLGGGFDSTVANLKIGASVNPGTAGAWTVTQVDAQLYNLVW